VWEEFEGLLRVARSDLGKSIGLAFFLVVAIKTNLSTFAAAKIRII
jgi:predicted RNA-binding protein YlqC (UPF0109 family)